MKMRNALRILSNIGLLGLSMTTVASEIPYLVGRDADGNPLLNYGVILLPSMELMDALGPLDSLQLLAHTYHMNLFTVAEKAGDVSSGPTVPSMNTMNSSFWPSILASYTFDNAPEIDVLIVPGGPAVRNSSITAPAVQFVRDRYPRLKYLITICTGAGIAAQAGVLDRKRATTNKAAWSTITAMGPRVKWVAPARWIVDGNIWTSSGVTAGIDLAFTWISQMYSEEDSYRIQGMVEYTPEKDHCHDTFATRYNVSTIEKCT